MATQQGRTCFDMGENTLKVPMKLFKENRTRLCENLRKNPKVPKGSVVLLQGGNPVNHYNTDVEYVFQQEPYFHWTFGVTEPGFYGVVVVDSGEVILFMPRLPESYATWMGPLKTPCDFKDYYEVEKVTYSDQIKFVLRALGETNPVTILTLAGRNTDSDLLFPDPTFDGIDEFPRDAEELYPVITTLRVFKTHHELEIIRYTNRISSEAHKQVMRKIKPGMKEYQCESIFLDYCYFVGGSRFVAYTCICGSGPNGSVLHYGHAGAPNNKTIKEGEMCLFDMGCSYYGYASDITCSFPVCGKFTEDQKLIYEAVLHARNTVFDLAKPGVSWVKMHEEANKALLHCLRNGGLLKGEIKDMMDAGLAAIFQPHGLGHLLGCDVHDVGGYMKDTPPRPEAPGFNKLRTARILEPNMILTVEPGCYFIDWLLDGALEDAKQSKFLVKDVIERFRGFGGVRIEDNILVTENGIENLTVVPRTVHEIEKWMAKTEYEKTVDTLINGHCAMLKE